MISRRPSILKPRQGIQPKAVAPRAVPRATPRILKPPKPEPIGLCLLCGDPFAGPEAIRLRQGCVRQRKWGTEFIELPFDDHSKLKWLCTGCALDNYVVSDDVRRFSSRLCGLSDDGQCCLCKQVIEPYPLEEWSSAILIELGAMKSSTKGAFSIFQPQYSGHLHYFCMDDLNLELWRLIERTDVPDYREYLSSCE